MGATSVKARSDNDDSRFVPAKLSTFTNTCSLHSSAVSVMSGTHVSSKSTRFTGTLELNIWLRRPLSLSCEWNLSASCAADLIPACGIGGGGGGGAIRKGATQARVNGSEPNFSAILRRRKGVGGSALSHLRVGHDVLAELVRNVERLHATASAAQQRV